MGMFFIIAAVAILVLVAVHLFGTYQFAAKISSLKERLLLSQAQATAPDPSHIPPIVRRFATRNGARAGGPPALLMVQDAEMRLRIDQAFFRQDATQVSGTRRPGFVWQATGVIAAVIPVRIVDAYVDGEGGLEVRLAGSVPVSAASGAEMAKGEAMRFLAELPWNPEAILNADGLSWRQIDDDTVEVSTPTVGGPARVVLHFDQDGDIASIEAPDRPRAGDTPARWIGRFSDYAQVGAYRFPRRGEVAWDLPEAEFVYWRGNIVSIAASGN